VIFSGFLQFLRKILDIVSHSLCKLAVVCVQGGGYAMAKHRESGRKHRKNKMRNNKKKNSDCKDWDDIHCLNLNE
jgi:hypothetical protein